MPPSLRMSLRTSPSHITLPVLERPQWSRSRYPPPGAALLYNRCRTSLISSSAHHRHICYNRNLSSMSYHPYPKISSINTLVLTLKTSYARLVSMFTCVRVSPLTNYLYYSRVGLWLLSTCNVQSYAYKTLVFTRVWQGTISPAYQWWKHFLLCRFFSRPRHIFPKDFNLKQVGFKNHNCCEVWYGACMRSIIMRTWNSISN